MKNIINFLKIASSVLLVPLAFILSLINEEWG